MVLLAVLGRTMKQHHLDSVNGYYILSSWNWQIVNHYCVVYGRRL